MKDGTKRPRRPHVLSRYKRETSSTHVTSNTHLCLLFRPSERCLKGPEPRTLRHAAPWPLRTSAGWRGVERGLRTAFSLCSWRGRVYTLEAVCCERPWTETAGLYAVLGTRVQCHGFLPLIIDCREQLGHARQSLCTESQLLERGTCIWPSALR